MQCLSTYEVATACALAIQADKLICIIDGHIHDEHGRLTRFMSLQDADLLIRNRAKQSEIAAKYVKAVGKGDDICKDYFASDASSSSWNGNGLLQRYKAIFQNGVGFANGNGLWSGGQGFAIGGEDWLNRSNGYLSELAAAAFVCRVSLSSYQLFIVSGSFNLFYAAYFVIAVRFFLSSVFFLHIFLEWEWPIV